MRHGTLTNEQAWVLHLSCEGGAKIDQLTRKQFRSLDRLCDALETCFETVTETTADGRITRRLQQDSSRGAQILSIEDADFDMLKQVWDKVDRNNYRDKGSRKLILAIDDAIDAFSEIEPRKTLEAV